MTPEIPDGLIHPGSWMTSRHFYPRVPNAQLHPLVRFFMTMGNTRIAERYAHLHPEANRDAVHALLATQTDWFRWSGADLFHTTDERGVRRMVIIETNSSPSGQKSMPLLDDAQDQAGYRRLLSRTFLPLLQRRGLPAGGLAVLWDKNPMEVGGYAAVLADLTDEPVHIVYVDPEGASIRWDDGVLHVQHEGAWTPIRAAFRYVTQRPWSLMPAAPRTAMLNPAIACLAGGRNKLVAAKAYEMFNARMADDGLIIRTPETVPGVPRAEVPMVVERMGGVAVVKVPYSNAGQGVATVTSPQELEAFLDKEQHYDRCLVQALIGNVGWSSRSREGKLYHVGTVPNPRNELYVADLRLMVGSSPEGFYPVAMCARRARKPLTYERPEPGTTWDMLGTNLSVKLPDGSWTTEPDRLILMDTRDFNRMGIGLDDLIEGYMQTVMATVAIDQMADSLVTTKGRFRRRFFGSLNPDDALLEELFPA